MRGDHVSLVKCSLILFSFPLSTSYPIYIFQLSCPGVCCPQGATISFEVEPSTLSCCCWVMNMQVRLTGSLGPSLWPNMDEFIKTKKLPTTFFFFFFFFLQFDSLEMEDLNSECFCQKYQKYQLSYKIFSETLLIKHMLSTTSTLKSMLGLLHLRFFYCFLKQLLKK